MELGITPHKITKRPRRLLIENPESFEEERIMMNIEKIMDHGGTLVFQHLDGTEVECSFVPEEQSQ